MAGIIYGLAGGIGFLVLLGIFLYFAHLEAKKVGLLKKK